MVRLIQIGLLSLATLAFPIQAALITAPVGGLTTTFDSGSTCHVGPSSGVDAGFSVSASFDACYPYSSSWGLVGNGQWTMSLIGDNSTSTMITIDLGGFYSSVGGFMNYAPGYGTPVIEALAGDGTTVLESYDISALAPISTPGGENDGAFRGISRSAADIAFLRVGGSYLAMHDITLHGTAVPEPASILLIAGGLAALGVMRRRLSR